jgi:divalent metal cation (Fe/Co/Zn/Cd) transporter
MIVHNYGPGRSFASLHVEVSADSDVLICHEKIDACERDIYEKTGVQTVIHMDPIVTDDEVVNKVRSEMSAKLGTLYEGLTLHDFRMVKGEKRTNVIFDVAIPYGTKLSSAKIKEKLEKGITDIDPKYCPVIIIEYQTV